MTDTGYDHSGAIVNKCASGYSLDPINNSCLNAACWDVSLKFAAGGLYSTVGDLYKWDQASYSDQYVFQAAENIVPISRPQKRRPVGNPGLFLFSIRQCHRKKIVRTMNIGARSLRARHKRPLAFDQPDVVYSRCCLRDS